MPPLPGGLHPWEPMLEFDTTPNLFRDELLREDLGVWDGVRRRGGHAVAPTGPGLGVEPDRAFLERFAV